MNAGPIAERVYDALRRLILGHGFLPGQRLDPNQLAERLIASVTPVREALNILCGEQLVEARRAGGFFIPSLNEPLLKDMYAFSNEIAMLSLRRCRPVAVVDWDRIRDTRSVYADRIANVLEGIAHFSLNGEHARAMGLLNARLHAIRVLEPMILTDALAETIALEQALDTGDKDSLRRRLNAFHRRRIRAATDLVRAVYKTAPVNDAQTIEE
ncbi:GntR family transcriptional regulator [Novosphingobium cyanobacteriorum]|uniref:GntR family transcriptional regulator n=1 Tax=Novosphingobium cyanobacteriorum TaxID=3024215 RepID=A0ABT6CIP0_9SPHN|nr:GntR family transcriptional regulator [Novosphingobium cyanobacteriorum]MDF8333687.1 GntR family transcriptional regulator [Novosphingobium cyanobacteriorum]